MPNFSVYIFTYIYTYKYTYTFLYIYLRTLLLTCYDWPSIVLSWDTTTTPLLFSRKTRLSAPWRSKPMILPKHPECVFINKPQYYCAVWAEFDRFLLCKLCFRCNTIQNYIQRQQETAMTVSLSVPYHSCCLANFIMGARRHSPGAMSVWKHPGPLLRVKG